MTEIDILRKQVDQLNRRVHELEREVEFLRVHPTIAQGLKGERFICSLTQGIATTLNASFDVAVNGDIKIEVKFSKLNTPERKSPKTKRWTWCKPMGWLDKGKEYDFLVLVGEKDYRYEGQYIDDSPYVMFIIPAAKVPDVISSGRSVGANINLTTNFSSVRSPAARIIIESMVSYLLLNELLVNSKTY